MYLHQVIDDLDKKIKIFGQAPSTYAEEFFAWWNNIRPLLCSAQCFHFPPLDDVVNINKKGLGHDVMFCYNSDYLKLPYSNLWIDYEKYINKNDGDDVTNNVYESKKRGIHIQLLQSSKQQEGQIWLATLFSYINKFKTWSPNMYFYKLLVGNAAPNVLNGDRWIRGENGIEKRPDITCNHKGHIILEPIVVMPGLISREQAGQQDRGDLSLIHTGILLLNAKNIITTKVLPPDKVNKKRIRNKKQPIFTYHTLSILNNSKHIYKSDDEPLNHNRIHLCRGHFKEFKDKGLFGRYTGLWWWEPYVRGKNRDGVVMKDYEVKQAIAV